MQNGYSKHPASPMATLVDYVTTEEYQIPQELDNINKISNL